jgi:protein O-mannosyl-transferase
VNSDRASFIAACAAAAVLVVAAYANSVDNTFHFDDAHVIETNLFLRSLGNIPLFFTDAHTFSSLPQNATYRPLVTLSLAIDYAIAGGLTPRVFHIHQIVLLLITGALLVLFFLKLTGSPNAALIASALFCLHTANTETMNLISARSELLSTIGLLGSFLLFLHVPFARRTLLYLVPLAIGALAKAPLVVFAPLLYFYVRLFEEQPPRRALRTILPPLLLGIALLVFLNAMNAPEWQSGGGSRWRYLITQPFVWLHYFRLFFFPIGLTADTDWQTFAHWYDTRAFAGYAFIAALIAWYRRGDRVVAFGIAWFAIALMPTSSIFPLAEIANEHRIFFAYIGLSLAVVWFVAGRTRELSPNLVTAFAMAVLIAHAIGTQQRNQIWHTGESLWADVVAKSPGNGRAWVNYGLTQMGKGRYLEAKQSFNRAAESVPNYSILAINRGIVEGELGNQQAAESYFLRALELSRDHNSHFFYARWLVRQGRGPEAMPHLREALRISPAFVDARALLLGMTCAVGLDTEMRTLAEETRRLDPGAPIPSWPDFQSAFQAGLEATAKSDWVRVACANREALRRDPRSADALNNLGWALASLGFREEAIGAYTQALAVQPGHDRARNNLALLGSR